VQSSVVGGVPGCRRPDRIPLHRSCANVGGDPFLLRSLTARGFAAAILPRSLIAFAGPDVELRSLRPALRLPVVLAWRRDRAAPPAARAFRDFVLGAGAAP